MKKLDAAKQQTCFLADGSGNERRALSNLFAEWGGLSCDVKSKAVKVYLVTNQGVEFWLYYIGTQVTTMRKGNSFVAPYELILSMEIA